MTALIRKFALGCLLLAASALSLAEAQSFATPEAAVTALRAALKADDDKALVALVGEPYRHLVITGSRAENSAARKLILDEIEKYQSFEKSGDNRQTVLIGPEAWPMAIPLVRENGQWRFAAELGEEELLNRRIGANELHALRLLRAYVEAQREYASRDRDGDQVLEYAQKLGSSPGKQDGLYWPADPAKGEETSPFGPLVAASSEKVPGRTATEPLRGYHFRILKRQGKSAAGGAYGYVINGNMVAGFALIATPAEHGISGVMSFLVNQNGTIYEKDLGKNSAKVAASISEFNPDASWKKHVD